LKTYTITLTDAQDKALQVIALDPQEFLQNFAVVRADTAIDDIVAEQVKKALDSGGTITGTRDDIVLSESVETAVQVQARLDAMAQSTPPGE
jgi:hypothetical protein